MKEVLFLFDVIALDYIVTSNLYLRYVASALGRLCTFGVPSSDYYFW